MVAAAPTPAQKRTRDDVLRQRTYDQGRGGVPAIFLARVRAVLDAQDAAMDGEEGATYALRQAYIDVAAVAEILASELPPPDAPL